MSHTSPTASPAHAGMDIDAGITGTNATSAPRALATHTHPHSAQPISADPFVHHLMNRGRVRDAPQSLSQQATMATAVDPVTEAPD
eukprot:5981110-Heterocapsa_arctica.AAC.1